MKDDQDNLPSERHVWVTSIISALARGAEGDSAWSLYPSEAAALLFEIERLRAHNTELQAHGVSLHKAAAAGAQAERAAVVAYLRDYAAPSHSDADNLAVLAPGAATVGRLADAIGRGAHIKEMK